MLSQLAAQRIASDPRLAERALAADRASLRALPTAEFLSRTKIKVPISAVETARVPFVLWPAQADMLSELERERLLVLLKARQLGMSWLICGYVLSRCVCLPGQTWLLFSQGQLEANELAARVQLMHDEHTDRASFPTQTKDNTGDLAWANDSRVLSLPATKKAGRSFSASGVVLDEWAFMTWGGDVLAAVKPTIDAGGQLIILSSADGAGTPYHQFWNAAKVGSSSYRAIFLPWFARPDRGPAWRDEKLREAHGNTATIYREYPANDLEAFTNAAGLIYDTWSDGPADGNVTEAAEIIPDGGDVVWAVDDGYAGKLDPSTSEYTADSHPRVFLLCQVRHDGTICVFAESYAARLLSETHIDQVQALTYPEPDHAVVDKSAAELKGRLHARDIGTRNGPSDVEESIKATRAALATDTNGRRRILVHPRCRHLRFEMAAYRRDADGRPVKAHDHGPDALRYLAWTQRHAE